MLSTGSPTELSLQPMNDVPILLYKTKNMQVRARTWNSYLCIVHLAPPSHAFSHTRSADNYTTRYFLVTRLRGSIVDPSSADYHVCSHAQTCYRTLPYSRHFDDTAQTVGRCLSVEAGHRDAYSCRSVLSLPLPLVLPHCPYFNLLHTASNSQRANDMDCARVCSWHEEKSMHGPEGSGFWPSRP